MEYENRLYYFIQEDDEGNLLYSQNTCADWVHMP